MSHFVRGRVEAVTRRIRRRTVAACVLAAAAVSAPSVIAAHTAPSAVNRQSTNGQGLPSWVTSWAAMPQLTEPANLPPAPFTQPGHVLDDTTLRQTVHISTGGRELRLRFSNAFGGAPLPITKVTVALPAGGAAGVSAIQPGSGRRVTFGGRPSTVIPMGALIVSDPVDLEVPPQANVTVTLYLGAGQASDNITSHPGSRTTSYLLRGDATDANDLPGATPVDHWYFLSGLEVPATRRASAAATVGDSLTDGRGSTTNANDRWPDQLLARLQTNPSTRDVAVINEAAGGNRVLNDGLGPNALARFDRDVIAQSGVDSVIVFEGVNDIGTGDASPAAQQAVADDLVGAYRQFVIRAHAEGIRIYGATITPFGGNTMYDDPQGVRERTREAVNEWIRTSGQFDAVLDFDRAVRDPQDPARIRPDYDVGDHLHLNPAGYGALAASVPAQLFGSR
jgi:lysophospholipase L1-like esterase